MQAHSNVVWSQQRKHESDAAQIDTNLSTSSVGRSDGPMYTGIFALFFVLLASAVVLFKAI
jgi:hypothetical protein